MGSPAAEIVPIEAGHRVARRAGAVSAVGDRVYRVVAATDAVASDGIRIPLSAWRFDRFRSNPVLTFAHRMDIPPIGTVPEVAVSGGRVEASIEFAPEGDSEFADEIARLWASGVLRAVSVGGQILSAPEREADHWVAADVELDHLAVASVGADPGALAIARCLDVSDDTLSRLFVSTSTATLTRSATPVVDHVRRELELLRLRR